MDKFKKHSLMTINLENLCSIKKSDFDTIFNDFFIVRWINQRDIEIKLDPTKIYTNYEINKIEIREWLSYESFVKEILPYFNPYYYDGDHENNKDIIDLRRAHEWINKYIPVNWLLLENFEKEMFNGKPWSDFIEWSDIIVDKSNLKWIRGFLRQQSVQNVKDIESDKRYVILSAKNKPVIQTWSQILWSLHWDIWEFILFFLTESILKEPILFSKFQHCKSGPWDKIKWSDWIHIKYNNWVLKFSFLESKFKKDFAGSLSETIISQKKFLENKTPEGSLDNEIRIIDSNESIVDKWFPLLFGDSFKHYINPYFRKEKDQKDLPFDLVSWLIYECSSYWDILNKKKDIKAHIDDVTSDRIQKTLEGYKEMEWLLDNRKVTIFLLPLINNEELIKTFLDQTKT